MELLHTARLACLLIIFWNEIKSKIFPTFTMAQTNMDPPTMYTCEYNFACNLIVYFEETGALGSCDSVVSPLVNMEKRPIVAWTTTPENNETFWLVMVSPNYFFPNCNPLALYLPFMLLWAVKATSTAKSTAITLAAEDAFKYTAPTQSDEATRRYQLLLYYSMTTDDENPFLGIWPALNMSKILSLLKLTPTKRPRASFQFRLEVKALEVPKGEESTTLPTVTDPGTVTSSTTEKAAEVEQSSLSTCLKPTIPRGLMTMIGIVLAMVLA